MDENNTNHIILESPNQNTLPVIDQKEIQLGALGVKKNKGQPYHQNEHLTIPQFAPPSTSRQIGGHGGVLMTDTSQQFPQHPGVYSNNQFNQNPGQNIPAPNPTAINPGFNYPGLPNSPTKNLIRQGFIKKVNKRKTG